MIRVIARAATGRPYEMPSNRAAQGSWMTTKLPVTNCQRRLAARKKLQKPLDKGRTLC